MLAEVYSRYLMYHRYGTRCIESVVTDGVNAMGVVLDTSRELERQDFIGANTALLVSSQKLPYTGSPYPGVATQTAEVLTVCGFEEW